MQVYGTASPANDGGGSTAAAMAASPSSDTAAAAPAAVAVTGLSVQQSEAIVAIAVLPHAELVVTASAGGVLQSYALLTGVAGARWVFDVAGGTVGTMVALTGCDAVMVTRAGGNAGAIWVPAAGAARAVDFGAEFAALRRSGAHATCATYDEARATLFTGYDDGSVFVRAIAPAPAGSDAAALSLKLLRVCAPTAAARADAAGAVSATAAAGAGGSVAAGIASAALSTMWYDTVGDALFTGDAGGVIRVVARVSGVAHKAAAGRGRAATAVDTSASAEVTLFLHGAASSSTSGDAPSMRSYLRGPPRSAAAPAGETWELGWAHGSLTVISTGGMLGPLVFTLPGGARVSPLFVAPWEDHPDTGRLPPMLRRLRGEFVCVPFGGARRIAGLSREWEACRSEAPEGPLHGPGAHAEWRLVDRSAMHITCQVDYPEPHPVKCVRKVRARARARVRAGTHIPVTPCGR